MKIIISESQLKLITEANKGHYVDFPTDDNIALEVWETNDRLELESIVIPKEQRGQGLGTNVMKMVCDYADEQNKPIYLTPDLNFGGTSINRLKTFYKKFGFIKNKDYEVSHSMVRYPNNLNETTKELTERKSVGVIYHFTSYNGMTNIIKDGMKLKSLWDMMGHDKDTKRYISFTRDKNMVSDTVFRDVRITVDGTRLSDKYQITPFADIGAGYGRRSRDEREERALVKKKDGYVDIYNSLMGIEIKNIKSNVNPSFEDDEFAFEREPPSYTDYMELIDTIKKTNLPYKIVNKF